MVQAHRGDDRGQAVPLAAAMLAVVVVALVGLVPLGVAVHERAAARTAADAAALAGAIEGEQAARQLADANGGELVTFQRTGDEVLVRVRVGDAAADARARAISRSRPPASGPGAAAGRGRGGLAPAMLAALARADGLPARAGLCQPLPATDPVHFVVCG
jgi:hypothetical protein